MPSGRGSRGEAAAPGAEEMNAAYELVLPVAVGAVERSWDLMFPKNPGNHGYFAMAGDEGGYYLSRYEERWAGLYQELLPFARIPLVRPNPEAWAPQKKATPTPAPDVLGDSVVGAAEVLGGDASSLRSGQEALSSWPERGDPSVASLRRSLIPCDEAG